MSVMALNGEEADLSNIKHDQEYILSYLKQISPRQLFDEDTTHIESEAYLVAQTLMTKKLMFEAGHQVLIHMMTKADALVLEFYVKKTLFEWTWTVSLLRIIKQKQILSGMQNTNSLITRVLLPRNVQKILMICIE